MTFGDCRRAASLLRSPSRFGLWLSVIVGQAVLQEEETKTDLTNFYGKVTFKNILVTLESVRIEAEAPSSDLLAQFTDTLQAYPKISEVTVDKVENKTSTASISITISARLQKNEALSAQTNTPAAGIPTEQVP